MGLYVWSSTLHLECAHLLHSTQGRVLGYGLRNDVGTVEDRNGHIISELSRRSLTQITKLSTRCREQCR